MWNFLNSQYQHYLVPHKFAEINWIDKAVNLNLKDNNIDNGNSDKGKEQNTNVKTILSVEYDKRHNQTSAGFRTEIFLEPNSTYQLDIKAKLISGDIAFVYVESGRKRLVPRFKIYKNLEPYVLTHNFTTPADLDGEKLIAIPIYLGILFFNPDQDYLMEVHQFTLRRVEKLTAENLIALKQNIDASILESNFDIQPSLASQIGELIDLNIPEFKKAEDINIKKIQDSNITAQNVIKNTNNPNYIIPDNNFYKQYINKSNLTTDWDTSTVAQRLFNYKNLDNNPNVNANNDNNKSNNKSNIKANNKANNKNPENPENTLNNANSNNFKNNNHYNSLIKTRDTNDVEKILFDPQEIEDSFYGNGINNEGWLPSKSLDRNVDMIKEKLQEDKINIHISLTVTPSRLGKVDKVVETLLNQNLPIKTLILVIPDRYKRFDRPYLINSKKWYFKSDPRLRIFRTPDIGPMTKLQPVIGLDFIGKNDIILTADDDHLYPPAWAFHLVYLPVIYPKFRAVYGLKAKINEKIEVSKNHRKPINADWLLGETGVAYPVKWIKSTKEMLKQVGFSQEAFYSDNILIANHLAKLHIARILIPTGNLPEDFAKLLEPRKAKWSNSRDSLGRMKPPLKIRQQLVIDVLKKKRHYFFDWKGPTMKRHLIEAEKAKEKQANKNGNKMDQVKHKMIPKGPVTKLVNGTVVDPKKLQDQLKSAQENEQKQKETTNHLVRTKFKKFDPANFDDKKVRYISYQTQVFHVDWVLLYIRRMAQASLEMPNLANNISLPNDYAQWFNVDVDNYDVIVIDIPFCLEKRIAVKSDKPVYYIYRYPDIGNPTCIFDLKTDNKKKHVEKAHLMINTYYHSNELAQLGSTYIWRAMPEIEVKQVGSTWNPNILHFGLIVQDGYFPENVDGLLDFWRKYCCLINSENDTAKPNQNKKNINTKKNNFVLKLDQNGKLNINGSTNKDDKDNNQDFKQVDWRNRIKLHIGVTPPLSNKIQNVVNGLKLKNVNIYTTSNVFGTMISKCNYYFTFGYGVDLYGAWAHSSGKKLLAIKYGEFKDYPKVIGIPFEIGSQQICPDLLHDHSKCDSGVDCKVYGSKVMHNVPVVKQAELTELIMDLVEKDK